MPDLFARAGSLRSAYDAVDWAATPLGPVDDWSPALRAAVDLTLNTGFPITLLWGPEAVLVYNEAYVDVLAEKHPWALGRPAREVFAEAWDYVGGLHRQVMGDDEAVYIENALVPLVRYGFLGQAYYTFAYSPVHGADGAVEGVIDIVTETTAQVIVGRRLRLLTRLGDVLVSADRAEDVVPHALQVLAEATDDLAWAEVREAPSAFHNRDYVLEETAGDRVAWLPLGSGLGAPGSALVIGLHPLLPADTDYLGFLSLLASTIDQAIDRVRTREAERSLSEALQRSLLTAPPASAWADVAVRYQPAAEAAQVGGDWYDAFTLPDGTLTLVVGDVAGHDESAAAAMGQLRSLVRGIAYTGLGTPAAVLSALDSAMAGLAVGTVATALVAQARPAAEGGIALTWASAGHPPPVLSDVDGAVLVEHVPDLLLGLDPAAARTDHELAIGPDATLLLYTDGLVERRGVPITDSLEWLRTVVGAAGRHADELCEHLLDSVGRVAGDDVALLVLRGR
ncbi:MULTISPECIES: PP2C family protein-serine/threonine phosphatase [unclassified Nocardioides]|uniref:PP2C family protein-serine/threonine phosphatase n=1 Tax=unclassified Nocardioides TaxID=2615069 RepID=UPI003014CB6F